MEVTKQLLVKYHLGNCTEAEKLAVEAWLISDDAAQSFPDGLDLDVQQHLGWEKISKRYDIGQNRVVLPPAPKKPMFKRILVQAAASMLLISTLAICYTTVQKEKHQVNRVTYQTITANKGEKKQVTLSDGTQVWLNADSRLIVPTVFTGATRSITFNGEGYFSVAKNRAQPFVIHSTRTVTQVVGTRFNLRDYQDEAKSELVVEEGKVLFSALDTRNRLTLTANQQGLLTTTNPAGLIKKEMSDHGKYTAWRANTLMLDDLTLSEIKPVLERWYNVKINITNKALANERYKGSFNNPPITEVLKRICFAVKASYHQNNQTFTIEK